MNVVIFLGGFMYNSANEFSYSIGNVLKQNNLNVTYVDLNAENVSEQLVHAFSKPVTFVLAFNGIGCNLQLADKQESVFNYLDIPFVYYLLDHPSHHYDRLIEKINKKIIVCLDNSHADYIEAHPEIKGIVTFIPTAAEMVDFSFDIKVKNKDIVFTGYIKTEQELNDSFQGNLHFLKEKIDELINSKRDLYLDREILQIIENNSKLKEQIELGEIKSEEIMVLCDYYIRGKKRNDIIQGVLDSGITLDFYGVVNENHPFQQYPNFINNGPVQYDELKRVYSESKITLNPMPNFPEGGHDRVFMSMLNGSIPLTDNNKYFEQNLPDTVLKFDYPNVETIISEVKEILQDDSKLEYMCRSNYEFAIEHHTWVNRLEQLIYVVNESINYWNNE